MHSPPMVSYHFSSRQITTIMRGSTLSLFWKNVPAWILGVLCVLSILSLPQGCAVKGAVGHAWGGQEYENTYLSATSPLGSKALNNWRNLDIDVRHFLTEHRDPDVIYSKTMEVTFFYLHENVRVRFIRPAVGFRTKIEQTQIPEDLFQQLQQRF